MRRIFSKLFAPPKHALTFAGMAIALSFLYIAIFVFQARVDVEIEIDTPKSTFFKVYWADSDQAFNEKRMGYAKINAQRSNYHFYIASLKNIDRIRIDPIEYSGTATLKKLLISQFSFAPINLQKAADYVGAKANSQIHFAESSPSDGLRLQTTGNDGHLELALAPIRQWAFPLQQLMVLGVLLAGLALSMRLLQPLLVDFRYVPYLLTAAFVLVLAMALSTGLDMHPDEVVHLSAVNYYASHFLPPPLTSEEAASTFSIYGHSRLSVYELYYQLAGYFQTLPALFSVPPIAGARSFGLVIFALLIFFSFRQKNFRPFALPLLISAQIWYLYSYANSDAFALALVIFVSYLVAYPGSPLNRFLTETRPAAYWFKLAGLGLLLGSLLLLKVNYYFFIAFLGLYFLWRTRQGDFPDRKRLWTRILLLALVGISLYGARFAMDIHANGWNKKVIQAQMMEKYAIAAYKPSTGLENKNPMLFLKDRGHSLGYIVVNARWFEKSFESAFGVYGFSDYIASKTYYHLVRYIGLLLLAVLLFAALLSRNRANLTLLLILVFCSGALITASVWHSWTVSFQPQGRYLLPILPMLGIYYYHVRQFTLPDLVEWLSVVLFLLALYSFLFTGLGNMHSLT